MNKIIFYTIPSVPQMWLRRIIMHGVQDNVKELALQPHIFYQRIEGMSDEVLDAYLKDGRIPYEPKHKPVCFYYSLLELIAIKARWIAANWKYLVKHRLFGCQK